MKRDGNRGRNLSFRETDRNPDPITKEPGSHPVGTAVGATAGGAAGAAAGAAIGAASGTAVGGPVGAGVGIVAGAIAGAAGGKSAAETVNPTIREGQTSLWRDYKGYQVVDEQGLRIGHLAGVWEGNEPHRYANPKYLGVRTGWIFGLTHLVPAKGSQVDRKSRSVVLPYSASQVKNAPTSEPGHALGEEIERAVQRHYGSSTSPQRDEIGQAASSEQLGTGEVSIPLAEERVVVGKRAVEAGGIRLQKVVRTEIVHQPIELRREEIIIERVTGSEAKKAAQGTFNEEVIFIPLQEEQAIVGKEAHIREEIRVRKKARTETQELHESVRKEDIELLENQDNATQPRALRPEAATTVQNSPPPA
jgi:uncharacterized protein (TIGR02271 family)